MAKIILEFDGAEEADDARTAMDGWKWKSAMWDLDQRLRATTKYGNSVITPNEGDSASELEIDIAEKYREILREILEGSNLKLD